MLTQLIHNGVLVPEPPAYRGLVVTIRGQVVRLTPRQEEMALAWAKKQGTPYVEDRTFVRNFLGDFSRELGLDRPLRLEEVDFGPAVRVVEQEKADRERLTKEERKAKATERKALREKLREQYGYAIVNGERVELANFTVEPSGIFMGRGEHPLRGRWKEGARQEDITLNLSPDAPRTAGAWAHPVWQPESLWVASWRDKLSGELKYVWLSDTAPIKQAREAQKFDKAHELHAQIEAVRAQIQQDLTDANPRRRMLATACYLIDTLCLRVGDEKDPDEADTVGATTLRPEHVTLHPDGSAEFRFLGKDSVLWHKKIPLPETVRANLEELSRNARPSRARRDDKRHPTRDKPQLFPDIGSQDVNAYLSRIMPGLTAKVFRTHHATMAVHDSLAASGVQASDPEFRKWEAISLANLEAAELCNHNKQAPKSWKSSRERFQERVDRAEARVKAGRQEVKALEQALAALRQEARSAKKEASKARQAQVAARYEKKIAQVTRRLEAAREKLQRAMLAHGALRAQAAVASRRRTWNLQTSLKSYIDPRVYHRWGQSVGYDVLARYYPTTLQRRFSWARGAEGAEAAEGAEG
jgi:DNA topoisomerase-1